MEFLEGKVYQIQSQTGKLLICTYIEDNTIWLKSDSYLASDTTLLYKYDRKKGKLYVFNTKVQAWDQQLGQLEEYNNSELCR